ncbi:hypothetical protein [Glutamicibacter uratoxydans]|uniref:hypothetical protein n=1 Tax=Glutamicibacter uratoxydans TaxID=43667 RepID=UPI003D6EAA16
MSEEIVETQDDLSTAEVTEQETEAVSEDISTDESTEEEQDTFPREYVEKLRKEAAGHRDRAKRADDLAQRLHTALVEATGRLADSRDLPFEESHLDDPAALTAAIDGLLEDKPHLATRRPSGSIGQGVGTVGNDASLAGILRAGAM